MRIPRSCCLDLKLPKVDGLQVLQQVKSDERLKLIPVVVLTSSHEEKDLARSYKLGVNAYVVKPVDFQRIRQCGQGARGVLGDHQPAAAGKHEEAP